MLRNRSSLLVLVGVCGGLVAGLSGCGRPAVVADGDKAGASEPAHAKEADKKTEDAKTDGAPFALPKDAGGALLAKVLPPTEMRGPLNEPPEGPHRLPPPPGLEPPVLPLSPSQAVPPRLPAERNRASVQPRLVVEEALERPRGDPAPPQAQSFYAGERTRLTTVDVNQPPPLPVLGQPVPDRASLDDPSADASGIAALAAPLPRRATPAPYVRLSLPDPFERRRFAGLPTPPDDAAARTGTVRPPKP